MTHELLAPTNVDSRSVATATRRLRFLVDVRHRVRPRGGDRCKLELGRKLEAMSNDVAFLTYDETRNAFARAVLEDRIVSTTRRPWDHPAGDYFEHVSIPRLCKNLNVDLYHGTFQTLPCLPLMRAARRTMVTIHDVALFDFPSAYSVPFRVLGRRLVARSIASADRVIAITKTTADRVATLFPGTARKMTVLLNGVGDAFLQSALMTRAEARASLPFLHDDDRPVVLFVGNIERKKNLPRLVQAFKDVQATSNVNRQLLIVGERPAELPDDGTRNAVQDPSIRFTGYLGDHQLPALYRAAECVAFPSLYEGFGMPVLEAMAAGTPVVTSSVSSLPEVAGGAAMLVDPYDVGSISRGLTIALEDRAWRDQAAAAGLDRAASLSWSRNAATTLSLYNDLI